MSIYNDFVGYDLVSATGSSNITPLQNIYYFAATSSIAYTYTLPEITCDGSIFKIFRIDRIPGATLTVVSTNNIVYGDTVVVSFDVSISSAIILISFNQSWYVSISTSQGTIIPRAIFSSNFTRANNTIYRTFTDSIGSSTLFASFTYLGTSNQGEIISGGMFIVYRLINPSYFTITFRNSVGAIIASTPSLQSASPVAVVQFSSFNQSLLPSTLSVLSLFVEVTGALDVGSIGISSFVIY